MSSTFAREPEFLSVSRLLRVYGLHPDKRLGQNFLQEPGILKNITAAAGIKEEDSVLEIGPGLGSLTRYLAQAAREVIAVELDQRLLPPLQEVLSPYANVKIIQGDILKLNPNQLITKSDYLVAANIPYYITSAVLRHLLSAEQRPRRMVLTIQKEVAGRICAEAGELSLLALSVQVYGKACVSAHIPAGSFYPAPKVDSSVLVVDIYPEPLVRDDLLPDFFRLTKAGFSQKRKKLRNSLSAGMRMAILNAEKILHAAGIDPQRRAETVSLEEWGRLVEIYSGMRIE
ncbi:MAG: ribosomal RNA small subunit methyltransferase A [Anaerolineales bacterium]|nr:ribosomal RNA small subunit methyltransferase A [Anaerolineales bacterium]